MAFGPTTLIPSRARERTGAWMVASTAWSEVVGSCAAFLSGRSRWGCPGVPMSSRWTEMRSDQWSRSWRRPNWGSRRGRGDRLVTPSMRCLASSGSRDRCYGLLVTECCGALESVGLDYQMGFFHRPRAGRPSLALDLAEELRALTDRFVVSLVRRQQIGSASFDFTPGGGVYLNDDARTALIEAWEEYKETETLHRILGRPVGRWAIPSVQATLLARHLRGDLAAYPPFVLP